ncbi:MAG: YceH family protein [Phycisphaerae bacterium]
MSLQLNPLERRVLGVLLEKSLTQPEYYPMSVNAIVAGCNQKNNRDPVMELDEDAIWSTLESLRGKHLVAKVLPSGTSRVDRWKHEVELALKIEKPQRAVLTELLLRGPQTVGELRTRAYRMYAFENIEAVSAVLDFLGQLDPPMVSTLPRGPRESAIRFAHTFYPPDEAPAAALPSAGGAADAPSATVMRSAPASSVLRDARGDSGGSLQSQVDELQSEVAELHQLLAELRRRIEVVESRM